MSVIPFPKRRCDPVELDIWHDPKNGIDFYFFETVERDGTRTTVAVAHSLEEAGKCADRLREQDSRIAKVRHA